MMNTKGLFLTALITFSATNTIFSNATTEQEDFEYMMDEPQRQGFKEIYGGGIIPGVIIGYITGKISQIGLALSVFTIAINQDNKSLVGIALAGAVAVLITENIVRKKIVSCVNERMEGHYIVDKKSQMETSARIASWVGLFI